MTITEADFAALLSADADAPMAAHGACAVCYPPHRPIPAEVVTICGINVRDGYQSPGNGAGRHRCAECVAAMSGHWPCGHQ